MSTKHPRQVENLSCNGAIATYVRYFQSNNFITNVELQISHPEKPPKTSVKNLKVDKHAQNHRKCIAATQKERRAVLLQNVDPDSFGHPRALEGPYFFIRVPRLTSSRINCPHKQRRRCFAAGYGRDPVGTQGPWMFWGRHTQRTALFRCRMWPRFLWAHTSTRWVHVLIRAQKLTGFEAQEQAHTKKGGGASTWAPSQNFPDRRRAAVLLQNVAPTPWAHRDSGWFRASTHKERFCFEAECLTALATHKHSRVHSPIRAQTCWV